MGFNTPKAPPVKMPPPAAHPPTLANASVQAAGRNAKTIAAAAEGQGFGDTVKTSPQGDLQPAPVAKNTLLGGT